MHTLSIRWLAAPFALVIALVAAAPAWAGPPTDQLRVQIERVIKVLEDPALKKDGRLPDRRAAIRQAAADIFDYEEVSKRSLGRHWQGRTPAERAEFTQVFTDLLEYSYISKIELYSGEKVQFTGEKLDADYALVNTKIVTPQGTEIPVDYRMYKQGDRWRAYDVNVEGVSLVANYRSQFNSILQRSSYPELIKMVKAKQEQLPKDVGKPAPARPAEAAVPAASRPARETP